MDRAFGFGPKGWGFDSLRAHAVMTKGLGVPRPNDRMRIRHVRSGGDSLRAHNRKTAAFKTQRWQDKPQEANEAFF